MASTRARPKRPGQYITQTTAPGHSAGVRAGYILEPMVTAVATDHDLDDAGADC
jgi:hypothetical protein